MGLFISDKYNHELKFMSFYLKETMEGNSGRKPGVERADPQGVEQWRGDRPDRSRR